MCLECTHEKGWSQALLHLKISSRVLLVPNFLSLQLCQWAQLIID